MVESKLFAISILAMEGNIFNDKVLEVTSLET